MLALLARSLGKGSLKAIRYIHHTPGGASSGLYPPAKNVRRRSGVCQSWTVGTLMHTLPKDFGGDLPTLVFRSHLCDRPYIPI